MNVEAFRAALTVIAVKVRGSRHKILQICFGRDGSLYVTFPYFKRTEGILTVASFPAGVGEQNINLSTAGKVSSHLVKYSHHPSGQAHFSQTGKIYTEIKRQSTPLLEDQCGHLFTVMFRSARAFETANAKRDEGLSAKRATLTFEVPDLEANSFRILGYWYHLDDLQGDPRPEKIGPRIGLRCDDGEIAPAFIVVNPEPGSSHALIIFCRIDKATSPLTEYLSFLGGFDPPEVVNDHTRPTEFLSFLYPVEDFAKLQREVGSVDLVLGAPISRSVRKTTIRVR